MLTAILVVVGVIVGVILGGLACFLLVTFAMSTALAKGLNW